MREGERNGNRKGGLCSFRTADGLLDLPDEDGVDSETISRAVHGHNWGHLS